MVSKSLASSAKSGSKHNSIKDFKKDELLGLYQEMLLIRRFEEKAGQLYGMGLIAGFCHLYIGQEAIASGMRFTMIDGDKVITTYRDHGHMIAVGSDQKKSWLNCLVVVTVPRKVKADQCIYLISKSTFMAVME